MKLERAAEKTAATGETKNHQTDCVTMAEWLMNFQEEPWEMLRHASKHATYFTAGSPGLGQFVFRDGTMLVSHNWGKDAFAVDPFCPASWQGYVFRMTEMGLDGYLIAPAAHNTPTADTVYHRVDDTFDAPTEESNTPTGAPMSYSTLPETSFFKASATVH